MVNLIFQAMRSLAWLSNPTYLLCFLSDIFPLLKMLNLECIVNVNKDPNQQSL